MHKLRHCLVVAPFEPPLTDQIVPDGEDKECSGIEDPEKMSEEEKEDVAQKVGEAIEIGNQKAEEEKAAADAKKAAEDEGKSKDGDKPKKGKIPGSSFPYCSSSSLPCSPHFSLLS